LARQPCVGPGLPQNCSPFFSIRCHTPPAFYSQNSAIHILPISILVFPLS
jgi:hypothetical protein